MICDAPSRVKRYLALLPDRLTCDLRGLAKKKRASCEIGAVAFNALISEIFANAKYGVCLLFTAVVIKGVDSLGMDGLGVAGLLDVDRAIIVVNGHDVSKSITPSLFERFGTAQVSILLNKPIAIRRDATCRSINGL